MEEERLPSPSGGSEVSKDRKPKPDGDAVPGDAAGTTRTERSTKEARQPAEAPGRGRGREIAALRSRTSRTFATERGSYVSEVFPGSVHYRDAQGSWKPIRNDLVSSGRAGWALENRANRYRLLLPQSLGNAPVRFERDRDWASFRLVNASGSARVSSNKATYDDALRGVDVEYEALNDLVRERLILEGPDSQTSFSWTVRTSPTIEPRLTEAGGVDFVTSSGDVRFQIAPPEIHDSAQPEEEPAPKHSYTLTAASGGHVLALDVNPQWLAAPDRVFPVVVDPPVAIGKRDCWIEDGDRSNLNHCTGDKIRVGFNGTYRRRALLEFNVGDFPDNAEILHARFGAYLMHANQTTAAQVNLRRVKEFWNDSVTWDDRTGWSAWGRSGGSFGQPGYDNLSVGAGDGWKYWYPTDFVNEAISRGPGYNEGMLLKFANESLRQTLFFASFDNSNQDLWPKLEVEWDFGGMGQLKNYTQESRRVSDRTNLKANVAGGNLMIHETDSVVRGINGHDLEIERYYNSLVQAEFAPLDQASGEGWTVSPSADTRLLMYTETQSNGDERVVGAALAGRSGYRVPFTKDPSSGKFESPDGLSADLRHVAADGEYRVQFRGDKERMFFDDSSGLLVRHEDKNGNTISLHYQEGRLVRVVDTQGRETSFNYDTYTVNAGTPDEETRARLRSIVEPPSEGPREHIYDYHPDHDQLLTRYTAPGGAVTTYGYNTSRDLLTSITKAMGNGQEHEWHFGYSTDTAVHPRFVTKMAEVTGSGDEYATTFYYDDATAARCTDAVGTGRHADVTLATMVLDARGQSLSGDAREARKTFYCYDALSRVEIVVDGNGHVTRLDYTADANVEYHRNARGAEFLYSYDQTGQNLIGTTGPDEGNAGTGAATKVEYQDERHPHFPTLIRDQEGHDKRITYDDEGNIVEVIEGADTNNPVTFRYDYDGRGNLTRIRRPDANAVPDAGAEQGNDTILRYYDGVAPVGSRHMLETIDHPDPRGDVSYTYDTLSRVLTQVDGKAQTTTYTYDPRDRVDVVGYADGSALDYAYDRVGNAVSRTDTDPSGRIETETYDYNARNLLQSEVRRGGTGDEYAVTYSYNKVRSLDLIDGPTSKTTYSYDNLELPKSLEVWDRRDGTLTNERTITFGYNSLHQRNRIDYPGGAAVENKYWTSGKLKKVIGLNGNGSAFRDFLYDYSDDSGAQKGKLQSRTNSNNNQKTTYSYDGLGRLTKEETRTGTTLNRRFSFTYDANSNLTCNVANDGSGGVTRTNLRYNQANELTATFEGEPCGAATPAGATTYGYDPNGNLTSSSAGFRASYDARDHTTSIRPDADGPAVAFDYAGPTQDERVAKSHSPDATTDKDLDYTHDLLGLASETETTTTGGVLGDTLVTSYIRDPQGEVLGYSHGNFNRYFVRDLTGSVTDIVNAHGDRMDWYTYSSYGELYAGGKAGEFLPFRFAQGYYDPETGLQKHGVRYYDTARARFTQLDPVFGDTIDPITLNRYQYGKCDPVSNVDPSGASSCFVGSMLLSGLELFTTASIGSYYAALGLVAPPVVGAVVGASFLAASLVLTFGCDDE